MKRKFASLSIMFLMLTMTFTACSEEKAENTAGIIGDSKESIKEVENEIIDMSIPPSINLTDALSSIYSEEAINSASYVWSYLTGEEMTEVKADALHPLDRDCCYQAIIEVPEYNGMDTTTYLLSCPINPDKITLTEWSVSQIGNTEAEGTTTECEESILKLTPDKVYEITLEWSVNKIGTNHCSGEASYVILTE